MEVPVALWTFHDELVETARKKMEGGCNREQALSTAVAALKRANPVFKQASEDPDLLREDLEEFLKSVEESLPS